MEVLARVRKNDSAEIRITREIYMGRPVINIRLWCLSAECGEMVPSRKGLTFDAGKWPELLEQLTHR
ncbi:hypothetical protein DF147_09370 [Burkholderia cenocepacia]|nr:hypothetical protein DF147_09370 [Burkholderia cenocepacia]RQV90699.1 hypothetical protein DF019_06235 [Burkholderia cenocepacia]